MVAEKSVNGDWWKRGDAGFFFTVSLPAKTCERKDEKNVRKKFREEAAGAKQPDGL
jgi:hypothetical protein